MHQSGGVLRIAFMAVIADRDIGTFAGKGNRNGATDAAVAAGNQGTAAFKPSAAAIAVFAVVGRGFMRRVSPVPGWGCS